MKAYSIEGQLSKRVMLLIALVFLSSALVINLIVTNWLENEYDVTLKSKASVLVTLVKDNQGGVDFDFADEFMPEFEAQKNPEYFQLWREDQSIFERSHSLKSYDLPYLLAIKKEGMVFQDITLTDGRRGRMVQIVFLPQIPEDEDRTPEKLASQKFMTLVVAKERETLDQIINLVHLFSFIGALIVLLIVNFLVKHTVRNSLKPVFNIKEQIKILSADNLKVRLDINDPPDELKDVIYHFNQLLTRLEQSFTREHRFSSDVAHELKTPIAELRSMAEVALKWPEDINLVKEFYSGVNDASKQMQIMVNNLLALARCEKGDVNLEPQEVAIKELIDECWQHHQHESKKKNIRLISRIPSKTKIITSLTEFEIIINNLISNAITYSPEDTDVIVDIRHHTDSVTLAISNIAEQLDQADLKLMFDRLWRKSESRSSSEHSGLGLPLVKAYIELIGLRISVNLSDKKTISFNIDGVHTV